jgi:hypothetical protein
VVSGLADVGQTRTRVNRCWVVTLANAKRDEDEKDEDLVKREVPDLNDVPAARGENDLPKREVFGLRDEATNIVGWYSYTIPLHLH